MKKRLSALLAAVLASLALWFAPKLSPAPTPTTPPEASPTPSQAPPEPSPAPLPTPPLAYLCKLPPAEGPSVCNEKPSDPQDYPRFQDPLMSAQDSADENGFVKNGKVIDEAAYTNEVVRILRVSGYCAINGRQAGHTSDDEVWIKDSNAFSEHYDIVTGAGEPWTKYASICRQAKF